MVGPPGDSALKLLDCHDARFWYPWHFHPEVEIKLIISGSGTRYIGDSIEEFVPGDLCIAGSGTPHCWSSNPVRGKWVRARAIQFSPELFLDKPGSAIAALLQRSRLGLQVRGSTNTEMRGELERLFDAKTDAKKLARLRVLLTIAAESEELRVLGVASAATSEKSRIRLLAREVLDYLNDNLTSPLGQAEAARRFGMSIAGFSRFFSREFGKPFVRYLAELRVGRAGEILVEREVSMAEVAVSSGFKTVANLDRHFRAVKGTTPTAYRRLARRMPPSSQT